MPERKKVAHILVPVSSLHLDVEDKLDDIFERQRAFAKKFFSLNLTMHSANPVVDPQGDVNHPLSAKCLTEQLKKNLEAIGNEVEEIRDWLPWKHWKNYEGYEIDLDEVRMEYIDLLHFVVEGMIILGMNPFEVHRYYVSKMEENLRRQREEYSRGAAF